MNVDATSMVKARRFKGKLLNKIRITELPTIALKSGKIVATMRVSIKPDVVFWRLSNKEAKCVRLLSLYENIKVSIEDI